MRREFKDLKYPREINIFENFLRERKTTIEDDLLNLSKKIGISFDALNEVKNSIRKVLEEASNLNNYEYLSTTYHLRPRAIDYLILANERMNFYFKNKNERCFHYPIYYQDFKEERPDLLFFGENLKISLLELIPSLEKDREKFKISLDFHQSLNEYLLANNWKEEIRDNLEKLIETNFSSFNKDLRSIVFQNIYQTIISILEDYKDFFQNSGLNKIIDNISNINKKLSNIILENFENLEPILQLLNIDKEYLKNIRDGSISTITGDFIFLIIILGNLVHIGAEYGKLNELRRRLGLKELIEPTSPQERFRFFEVSNEKKSESELLRLLFLTEKSSITFIYPAVYEGLSEVLWSPIDKKLREKIRILDFYLKLSNIKKFLEKCELSKNQFFNLLEKLNYFEHLKNEELETSKEIIKKLRESLNDENKNLLLWVENYNQELINQGIEKKYFKIFYQKLFNYVLLFVFESYIKGKFSDISDNLGSTLINEVFSKKEDEDFIIENFPVSPEDSMFYGLKLPLKLKGFSKKDLAGFCSLIEIYRLMDEQNYDKKKLLGLLP